MADSLRIGIDLGGTKIEGLALSGSEEVARQRVPTPSHDYAATVEAVASLVEHLEQHVGQSGTVGIGIPGASSLLDGCVKNANSVWLNGQPLQRDLERRLARPVRLANDANCFAISEVTDGAAVGAPVVFGVILGTGVGGGIVVNGRVLAGPNQVAGEWGHNPLPWMRDDERPGPACFCGRRGCVERFLSGPALAEDFRQATGRARTPQEIVAEVATAEEAPLAVIARYEDRLARALAAVINLLDPDVIVLGGGLSNIERLYDTVPTLWGPFVFGASETEPVRTRLVANRHGDSSGVRGAAWL